jgi:hypothetical protein
MALSRRSSFFEGFQTDTSLAPHRNASKAPLCDAFGLVAALTDRPCPPARAQSQPSATADAPRSLGHCRRCRRRCGPARPRLRSGSAARRRRRCASWSAWSEPTRRRRRRWSRRIGSSWASPSGVSARARMVSCSPASAREHAHLMRRAQARSACANTQCAQTAAGAGQAAATPALRTPSPHRCMRRDDATRLRSSADGRPKQGRAASNRPGGGGQRARECGRGGASAAVRADAGRGTIGAAVRIG